MKHLLIRFWAWLGRLLGIDTTTPPLPAPPAQPPTQPPTTSTAPPPVTLPPPAPPQLDLHTGEAPVYGCKASLLTKNEHKLYLTLRRVAGDDLTVMSKVRLGDFMWLTNNPPERKRHNNNLFCRHVDFLLCEPKTMAPLLVIELDDGSHKHPMAQAADRFKNELFRQAGLPLLRLPRNDYPPRVLREKIRASLDGGDPDAAN